MARPRRWLAAVALVPGLVWAPAAVAHPALLQSSPAPGLVAARAPASIALAFTEPVEARGSAVSVRRFGGSAVALGRPAVGARGASLRVALRAGDRGLAPGVYEVRWSALGDDGHQVGGGFRFGVAGAGGAAPPGVEQLGAAVASGDSSGSADGPIPVLARWIGLLAAALLVGGWLLGRRAKVHASASNASQGSDPSDAFHASASNASQGSDPSDAFHASASIYVRPERVARWAWAVALVAALETVVAVGASGAASGFDAALLTGTATGVLALVRAGGLALLGAVALRLRRPGLLGAAGAVALATHALDGHAAALRDDRGWAWLEALAHVEAAGVWAGGLLAIVLWSVRAPGVDARALARAFARPAAVAMAVLVVTGVLAAVREVDSWLFLRWSGYGRVVIVKSVLVVAALALAGWSVWRLRGSRPLLSRLRAEALLAVAIVALAATLAGIVQGRGQPVYAKRGNLLTGAALATAATPGGPVALTVAPGRPGANTITAIPQPLREGDAPPRPAALAVRLACACERDGERVKLRERAGGVWSARVELPAAGTWFAYVAAGGRRATAPVALAVGDPRSAGGPAPLRVLATADLSGPRAEQCRSFVQGLALAVGRLNASGGVDGGRKVALDVRDDGGDERRAAAVVRAGDAGVLAPCGAGGAGAIAVAEGTPVLAGDPATPSAAGARVFRVAGDPRAEGAAIGGFLAQQGLQARPTAPKRVAAVVRDEAGRQRLTGLRGALEPAGVTVEALPAAAAESAASLRRIAEPRRYLATILDGNPARVAHALKVYGGPDGWVVPSSLVVATTLATERFMLAAGALGRLGGVRAVLEISPDGRDALSYANGVQRLFRGERPTLSGLRGFVTGLALTEGLRDGSDPADIARRLRRPRRFTDSLAAPWRADAPAAGAQRFSVFAPNFLPANLIPARAGGERFSGTYFPTGAWTRLAPAQYGPAL